ncbi:MAG TPA: HPF/RaiA family ribosome-associated protein [Ignavibacteria bacterium]|nr:hypothetical protein [Bacteroidota bacterium]HRI84232.1 HPF/RaiA family ribosome-associated protein [Ignavibacteria bacterium]HRJ99046.1 HPF/RaiA family ribosome-associated protein [Ignavibacteria bacterium]
MKIQFNTDNNIKGSEKFREPLITMLSEELSRFSDKISRLEVFLTDETGKKNGQMDKRCVLEARIAGRQPVAVKSKADTIHKAVDVAVDKLKNSLTTKLDRRKNHVKKSES